MAQLICPLKRSPDLQADRHPSAMFYCAAFVCSHDCTSRGREKIKIKNRTVIVDRSISMHNACHDDSDNFKYPFMAKLLIPVCVILETPAAMMRVIKHP